MRPVRVLGASATLACALAFTLAGCGEQRSAEAYCDAFWDKAIPLHEQYTKANDELESNPINAIMSLFSSPRDLAGMFDSMSKVAPEEIRTDTEAVRDAFTKLADSYGETLKNPVSGLLGNLGTALSIGNAVGRVETYMNQHCGTPQEAIEARS